MNTERTIRQHEGMNVSRQMPRQSFTVRMPGDVYGSDWQELHRFVARYTPNSAPVSNSIMVRLGVWALKRLQLQAQQSGREALDDLGEEMARVAHTAATRKRGPDRADIERVYNHGARW